MQTSQDNGLKLVQLMCRIEGIDLDHESKVMNWVLVCKLFFSFI